MQTRLITVINFVLIIFCLILTCESYRNTNNMSKDLRMETQEIPEMQIVLIVENETPPFATNPVTLYERLTPEERNLIEVTIQHEVGAFSIEYKMLVAELIYNRLMSENFPNTIKEVLFQTGQFQGIAQWSQSGIEPDITTKKAVKAVFSAENPSHECLYYYNPELSSYDSVIWFEYSGDVEYMFSWTETDWGIEYETRFFK